jgi:lipopolysaccharide/colanic/teichoic acid biosynthesis glycosyltransferase
MKTTMGNSASKILLRKRLNKNNDSGFIRKKRLSASVGTLINDTHSLMNEKIQLLYIGSNDDLIYQLAMHPLISLVSGKTFPEVKSLFNSREKTDVILCERFLTGGDGLKVFRLLAETIDMERIPFILIAPQYEEGLMKTTLKLGIDDLYILPIPSVEDLVKRIDFLMKFKNNEVVSELVMHQPTLSRIPLSKRLFDIVVASAALVLLSPVLILVMIAIRLESKGKVYYTSVRVGRKPFHFYKFRSMRNGAEDELKKLAKIRNQYSSKEPEREMDLKTPCPCSKKDNFTSCSPSLFTESYSICETWYTKQKTITEKSKPHFIKIPDDPRVTKVGRIIRNTSIDELPQLINVIKGDMSIVGNRPLPVYEAEKLTFDTMAKRFLAPAGLTGLWQVEKRGKKGVMSDEERKQLDNQYAQLFLENKYSLFYDLKLILRTIPVLIQKESV